MYREEKRKKEFPWTVAAERMGVYPLVRQKPENRLLAMPKAAFSKLKAQQKRLFAPERDSLDVKSPSEAPDEGEISVEEQEVNRLLAVSGGLFTITTAGLWVPALNMLCLPTAIYLLSPFFKRIVTVVRKKEQVRLAMSDLFWSSGMLLTGHYLARPHGLTVRPPLLWLCLFCCKLMIKTQDHSMNSLINIFGEQPRSLWVLVDGVEIELPHLSVKAGDTVVIQAGQTIAVDGMIVKGDATIDQRALTGESQPVEKGIGEQVFASTVVLSGQIYVQVEKAGTETVAAQIGDILSNTASYQSGVRAIGLRIAEQAVIPMFTSSALALLMLGTESAVAVRK